MSNQTAAEGMHRAFAEWFARKAQQREAAAASVLAKSPYPRAFMGGPLTVAESPYPRVPVVNKDVVVIGPPEDTIRTPLFLEWFEEEPVDLMAATRDVARGGVPRGTGGGD